MKCILGEPEGPIPKKWRLGGALMREVVVKSDWICMVGSWHFDLNEAWYLYKRPGALKQAFRTAYRPP